MNEPQLPGCLPGIDVMDCLRRLGGKPKSVIRLFELLIGNYAGAPQKIREALDNKESEVARRLVHEIKGAAGNMSANDLFVAASELEIGIKFDTRDEFDPLLDNFHCAFDQVYASAKTVVTGGAVEE